MGFNCLKATATSRRQFTFYHSECWSFTCCFSWTHCQYVVSVSHFYRYYFGRCSAELAQLVPLPFSCGRSTHEIDCMVFVSPSLLDVTRMPMSTVSCLTQLNWNSLPIECFPLSYNWNGCKSRINRYLLTVGSL